MLNTKIIGESTAQITEDYSVLHQLFLPAAQYVLIHLILNKCVVTIIT